MSKDEIQFFKHCLKDYNYFWKHYNELLEVREDLAAERLALVTNTSSVIKIPKKDREEFDLYSSEQWHTLVEMQKDCEDQILFFYRLIKLTDKMLEKVEEPVRTMLKELYILKIPRGEVSRKHFYSDEKALYRAIRNYF